MKLPLCQKNFTKPSWRDKDWGIYSWNIEPILTKKTTAPKEISVKNSWKTIRKFTLKILPLKKLLSILSNYSKVYEKLIYNQLYQYFENILFPSQCRFRKGYSTQNCILVLIQKFKDAINTDNKFGALLIDLSKAFDCLDHSLLVEKLHWYGVSPLSLKLFHQSYLSHQNKIMF